MTHRKSDPETSRLGAEATESIRETAFRRMYNVWLKLPEAATANEAAALCVSYCGGSHETYRKRKGELEQAGLIRQVGRRRCRHTNHMAETFVANVKPRQKELFE